MRTSRPPHSGPSPWLTLALGIATTAAALLLFLAEKRRPLRRQSQDEPLRKLRNLVMGAASVAVVALVQRPLVEPLARRVAERRWGLARQLPAPEWARDAAAFLLLDYTIYVWHVLTHKVPFLWRFHVVHHLDMDMDTTTAMRFHAVDMAISIPWRAAQARERFYCGRAFSSARCCFTEVIFDCRSHSSEGWCAC